MDLLQLEYFVRVAESATMVQAAETMNVSQSTLSMSIKKLETELGTKLFRRSGHTLKLTPEGEILHKGAVKLLFDVATLKQRLSAEDTGRARTIIVASDAVDFAIESVYIYSALHPQATLQHIRARHITMRSMLLSRQVDFCLSLYPITDENVESTLLLSEPMYLLASLDSRFADMPFVRMRDLEQETLISLGKGHAFREICETYYSMLGMAPRDIMEVGEPEALSMSVRKRFGISFIPQSVQGKNDFLPNSGNTLCARPMQESFCYRNIYLSRLKPLSLSPDHLSYLEFLQSYTDMVTYLKRFPELEEYRAAHNL